MTLYEWFLVIGIISFVVATGFMIRQLTKKEDEDIVTPWTEKLQEKLDEKKKK